MKSTWALVDPNDLDPERRRHLAECQKCRDELAALDGDLSSLGEMAALSVQVPQRKISFVSQAAPQPKRRTWWGSMAAGLAAAAVLVLMLLPAGDNMKPAPTMGPSLAEMAAEARPADPSWLYWQPERAFNPFQEFMLAGDATVADPEFLDFVAPFGRSSRRKKAVVKKPSQKSRCKKAVAKKPS
jgi:hypothetical protein